ncbi:family 78 glycoside hydrolase catalytic domain [Oleiharenicola lentus]|uniref:family 78 glycoside hydrolase catalytic domain n=1 Tax=Oleiharenicola lentus TaxID=2508720 RepID=UPI003F666096
MPTVLAFLLCAGFAHAALIVTDLKTDHAVNPLGVDVVSPVLQWRVQSAERGQKQTAWQVLVASSAEKLAANTGDLWDSGKVSTDQTAHVPYAGKPLTSSQGVFWKVRSWDRDGKPTAWSEVATWTAGVVRERDWQAKWIGAPSQLENTLLRRDFVVKPGLRRALAHVTGLGQYELFLNGKKSGVDLLSPGWTNYRKTVLYDTRDITALLRTGANAVGLSLGNGMFHVVRPAGRFAKFIGSFGEQRAIAQIELDYADGSRELVVTDDTWRAHAGPITFSSIYGGEDFDARLGLKGWNEAGFDAAQWPAVKATGDSLAVLRGHSAATEAIAPIETRQPVDLRTLAPGVVVFDFGQNTSFMPRIRVSGPKGSVIKLTAGEVLKPDGTIERGTMGGAHRGSAWWQYTKDTDGIEEWFPQFYYLGSRYLYTELMAATAGAALPEVESVEQVIVHSTAEPVGTFATSNPVLNQIRDLVRWAQRSNMVSVLTDCPHREKLGWLEQNHLCGPALRYEWDITRLAAKNIRDIREAQLDDGFVPNIAPEYTVFKGTFRGAAEWGATFIQVPWQQYVFTGDGGFLREHYDAMKHYFAYLEKLAAGGVLKEGLGDWYDVVLDKGGRANLTPPALTATAHYYLNAVTLSKVAAILNGADEAKSFAGKAGEIRAVFNRDFFKAGPPEVYGTGSQTSQLLPVALGIVEPEHRDAVLAAALKDIETRGHATVGAVGTRYLFRALTDAGKMDLLYKLITNPDMPGYAMQLKRGNTALAESWTGQYGASQNHFFLGQVTEWFYHDLAGIQPDDTTPGFKHIVLRPRVAGDLTWVEASYQSIRGPIKVRWERDAQKFIYCVEIPANTTATLWLPASVDAPIQEGRQAVEKSVGVKFIRHDSEHALFALESGSYQFESKL